MQINHIFQKVNSMGLQYSIKNERFLYWVFPEFSMKLKFATYSYFFNLYIFDDKCTKNISNVYFMIKTDVCQLWKIVRTELHRVPLGNKVTKGDYEAIHR